MTLGERLHDIDWDEALSMNAVVDFAKRRSDIIHEAWPVGTRVRWLQTPNRDVFEAFGVVHEWPARVSPIDREPCVFIEFTKHPSLEAARRSGPMPFVALVQTRNLERIESQEPSGGEM